MAAGQDPSQFWGLTLRLIFAVLKGSAERARRVHNERAWQAHQTAFLSAYAPKRPNQFTKLSALEIKPKAGVGTARRNRSWEDDFAALSAWAARGKPH